MLLLLSTDANEIITKFSGLEGYSHHWICQLSFNERLRVEIFDDADADVDEMLCYATRLYVDEMAA